MKFEISQDNLYLILAGKASAVAAFIAEDEHLGPVALYQEYQEFK